MMLALIEMQPIPVRTGSKDREGRLVLFGTELVAVLVRLDDEVHGEDRGRWFLESAFGWYPARVDTFSTLAEAESWVGQKLAASTRPA